MQEIGVFWRKRINHTYFGTGEETSMIKSKWNRIIVLGAIMGSCFTAGVYAQDIIQRVDAYLRPDFNVVVNGQKVNLQSSPLIYNDSSYLPVKELASYLGAIVNWNGSTKTIYLNSRINSAQPEEGTGSTYERITLMNPYPVRLKYLGGEYSVLMNSSEKTYYRLKDVLRMGIDTSGLSKVKEKYTRDLYVSEEELKKAWKEIPKPTYSTDPLFVIGESDPKKLEALKSYVELNKNVPVTAYNPEYHYIQPILIDAHPEENKYDYLFIDNRHFYVTHLELGKNLIGDSYGVSSSSTENIEARID
jgi:hypothetical protein